MGDGLKGAHILVPVDGAEASLGAVRLAGEIASLINGTVDFLYVSPFNESTDEGDVAWLPESVAGSSVLRGQQIFTKAAAALSPHIPYRTYQRVGVAASEIIRFVNEHQNALIVVGRRKSSRMSGVLLGSVVQTIIEHVKTRVIVVGCNDLLCKDNFQDEEAVP